MKRGLNQQEAMEYVGVKRRTWEALWVPRLVGIPQGVSLIFDRIDLDRLFDEFKAVAAGVTTDAAEEATPETLHSGHWNGRPTTKKGSKPWAKTPIHRT